jgi:predicted enzyme related to lactoylglutathione lyase
VTGAANDGDLRIEIFVDDVERSVGFYCDVLGFTREPTDAGYAPVRRGRAVIGIGLMGQLPEGHRIKRRGDERGGIGIEIVLEVADVDAAHQRAVDAGWRVHGPVEARPWGLRDFRLADPDGYYVRVTSMA